MRDMVYEAFQQPPSIQSVVDPAPDKDGQMRRLQICNWLESQLDTALGFCWSITRY